MSRAHASLNEANLILNVGLFQSAGRSAYMACFHAAQALIFEWHGRSPKTHSGVQSQFALLLRNDARLSPDLHGLLGRSFRLKSQADYGTSPELDISADEAAEWIGLATRFLAEITPLIDLPPATG